MSSETTAVAVQYRLQEWAAQIVSAKYSCGFSNLMNSSMIVNEI